MSAIMAALRLGRCRPDAGACNNASRTRVVSGLAFCVSPQQSVNVCSTIGISNGIRCFNDLFTTFFLPSVLTTCTFAARTMPSFPCNSSKTLQIFQKTLFSWSFLRIKISPILITGFYDYLLAYMPLKGLRDIHFSIDWKTG